MIELIYLIFAVAIVYAFAATPLLGAADQRPTIAVARSSPIDGLRGLLALSVVFYHGYLTERFVNDGVWRVPNARIFAHLGPSAVAIFFMITGYLFWGKMLRDRGRPDWQALYIGRLFRIGPVYLLVVILMLIAVGFHTGWQLHVTARHLLHQIIVWLPLGAQAGTPNINGLPRTFLLTAGVTWSLRYEWAFYVALLLLATIARLTRPRGQLVIGFALIASLGWAVVLPGRTSTFPSWPISFALFLSGMFVASVPRPQTAGWRRPFLSAVVVVAGAASLATASAFTAFSVACLALAFYAIAAGCSIFGLLTTRAATRLGAVSYPLYLLHGLVLSTLAVIVRPLPEALFWTVLAGAAVLAVILATATHALVERPGVELGQRIARALTRVSLGEEATAVVETK